MYKLVLFSVVSLLLLQHCVSITNEGGSVIQDEFLLFAKQHPEEAFQQWAEQNSKSYAYSRSSGNLQLIYNNRFDIWKDNLEYVLQQSQHTDLYSHQLAMNSLADLSHEEYKQMLGYKPSLKKDKLLKDSAFKNKREGFMYEYENIEDLPENVDWRDKDAVSSVKNQGYCGSCWAFSTTGSIEGINALYTKKMISISEQELVDCDTDQDQGCNGGLMDYAFEFVIKNGGLDTEKDYPYDGEQERCNKKKERHHVVSIDSYQDVPENSEKDLLKAAANQPISVAIDAESRSFQMYGGGVFSGSCGEQLNHGVLVVGYGTQAKSDMQYQNSSSGVDYWIVKNSWGPSWGDEGYIKMKRNVGDKGICGIAMAASFPQKTNPNPTPGPEPAPTPGTPDPTPEPEPEPSNECNEIFKCEKGQTCCCIDEFMGFCFNFGCCEYEAAVCCEDKEHCCPSDNPVCNSKDGSCAARGKDGSVDLSKKVRMGKKSQAKFNWGSVTKITDKAKKLASDILDN